MDPTYIYWNRAYDPFNHNRHPATNERAIQPKQSRLLNNKNHRFNYNANEAIGSNQSQDKSKHKIDSTSTHNQQHRDRQIDNHLSVTYERLEYSWLESALPITILSFSILIVLLLIAWLIIWTKQRFFKSNPSNKTIQQQIDRYRIEARDDQIRMIDDDIDIPAGVYNQNAGSSSKNPMDGFSDNEKCSTPISPTASQPTFHYPQRQTQSPMTTNTTAFLHDTANNPIMDNTTITTSVPIHVSISVPASTIISQPINYTPTSSNSSPKLSEDQSPPGYRTTTIVTKPRARKVHQKDVCTPPPPPPQPMDVRKFSFVQTHQSHDNTHQSISVTDSHASTPHQSNEWTVNDSPTPSQGTEQLFYYHSSLEQMSPSTTVSSNNAPVHGYRYKPNYSPKILSDDKENAIPMTGGTGTIGVTSATSHSAASSPKIQRCGELALAQQNSPRIIDSSASSTNSRFTFSPRLLQQHSGDIITATSGISPLMTSAGYKHGNYFRFPDVDVFTPNYKPMTPTTVVEDKIGIEIITTTDDTDGINDDMYCVEEDEDDGLLLLGNMRLNNGSSRNLAASSTGSTNKTQATRRARLKSISLDSDGAKLVEENLGIPVEELVEIAAINSEDFDKTIEDNTAAEEEFHNNCATEDGTTDSRDEPKTYLTDADTPKKCHSKNKNNLSINLSIRDDSLGDDASDYDYKCNKIPTTPKTPTFTQHRQKAISLDSDPTMSSFESPWKGQQPLYTATSHINISSVSVPSTPKRQPVRDHMQSDQDAETQHNDCNNCCYTTAPMSTSNPSSTSFMTKHQQKFKHSKGSLFAAMRQDENKNRSSFGARSKLLGSFHEKTDFGKQSSNERPAGMYLGEMKTSQSGDYLGSNLQTIKTATLSVSNNNLKTLPEVMTLSDFGTTNKMSTSCSTTPGSIASGVVGKSRNSIIQRRGSNHSLTLNAEQGLSVSNYSLGNLQGSNCNLSGTSCGAFSFDTNSSISAIRNKKNLLQRRGSNTSLTLNIQGSSNSLNRFNSHSSLNISQDGGVGRQKKGLLERRNSNASLTLNIQNRGLSISNCNLRGSECSLSSINVGNTESFDQPEVRDDPVNSQIRHQSAHHHSHHRRKFLSSENLHNFSICLKQCDSESNIHHGSVSDLKHTSPRHTHITVDASEFIGKGDGESAELGSECYCDCAVRNISTKPLSPQTTSEDFKIYLANIQMLQSASNVLSDQQLRNLNVVFEHSYNKGQSTMMSDDKMTKSCDNSIGLATSTDDSQKLLLRNLHQEFWDLPTNYQEKPLVFGSQTKNRYKTILPNEHSRVILSAEPGLLQEPYINANFIKGPDYVSNSYIATQGPLTNTIYEYWLMIYQNVKKAAIPPTGYQKIAMLTDFVENSRQKCAIYFPTNTDETMTFVNPANPMDEIDLIDDVTVDRLFDCIQNPNQHVDPADTDSSSLFLPNLPNNCNYFLVKTVEIIVKNGYTIRTLCVLYLNSSQWCTESVSQRGQMNYLANHSFYCHHYWFPDWPDHRSPDDIDVLLDMSLHLLDDTDEWNSAETTNATDVIIPLPVIHCSAGIGRTGCFAAILNGLRQMRTSVLQSASNSTGTAGGQLSVDILGIVCNLRLQRGGMVQNSEQYELIHRALCLYQKRLNCTTNDL
ncbi:uncharacterized protein LOC119078522 isoform X2 [Bradysia coprophila]|uniref:uncharacterized protein LOC119078522 isoform X2 n=1 Tax=Bradysia coprophila TaxID=38358 RepID=UPI00187D78AC|nr:uncharacterized protein LOC119078522 isoform X2 [Bradysia coprophila]